MNARATQTCKLVEKYSYLKMMDEVRATWKEILTLWVVFEGISSFIYYANYALYLDNIKNLAVENPLLWGFKAITYLLPSILLSLIFSIIVSVVKRRIMQFFRKGSP